MVKVPDVQSALTSITTGPQHHVRSTHIVSTGTRQKWPEADSGFHDEPVNLIEQNLTVEMYISLLVAVGLMAMPLLCL